MRACKEKLDMVRWKNSGIMHELLSENAGEQTGNEYNFQEGVLCLMIDHINM